MPKVILFDFDGPLADSLRRHIEFCLRMNEKYGGQLVLPEASDIESWRKLVGFPMIKFLTNLGFSTEQAQIIHDDDYLREFGKKRKPVPLYPGAERLIRFLKNRGKQLGIVSLNHRYNILATLGPLIDQFGVIYSYNEFTKKPPALLSAVQFFGIEPTESVYIADALGDYQAACAVKMPFIGTSYGWQITGQETEFTSAASPGELELML